MSEIERKLAQTREIMIAHGFGALRLKGVDWFSWFTGGSCSVVILTSEKGVGEILITRTQALVLTDSIEEPRFRAEEIPAELPIWAHPWQRPELREAFVGDSARGLPVGSDRPEGNEAPFPPRLVALKRRLTTPEIERYRGVGKDSAEAMTEVLSRARPDWTEQRLAGEGARALWERGIHPTLTLVAGDERLDKYRHPTATSSPLGSRAMLVFCGRRHGLYANLTRFVYFRKPTAPEREAHSLVAEIESAVLQESRTGASLSTLYNALVRAYAQTGRGPEIDRHHQGGTTGYLSREVVARPDTTTVIENGTALAWNPSLPGAKIEDTILFADDRLTTLTVDEAWPTVTVDGRARPDVLVRP